MTGALRAVTEYTMAILAEITTRRSLTFTVGSAGFTLAEAAAGLAAVVAVFLGQQGEK